MGLLRQWDKSSEARLDWNVPLFITYRIFFNLRFYYPVFALFYMDAGIDLETFGWLQGLWSLSIIIFEVPSGIIADLIGRRKTLRLGAFLAIVEMVVFALARDPFWFAVNRILSGFNESLVSGADSALLYDSLKQRNREGQYKEVLGKAYFLSLLVGSVATISGSYLYTLNIRLPIWVTAGCMLVTFLASMLFYESFRPPTSVTFSAQWLMLRRSLADVLASGELIFLIVVAFVVDCSVRIVLVHNSLYYQSILIPVAWFGVAGVGVRLLGSLTSKYAYRIDDLLGFGRSTAITCLLMMGAFVGMSLTVPYYGVVFPAVLSAAMIFISLNVEGEINKRISSDRRATILSLKSICLNIGFGLGMPLFTVTARNSLAVGFQYLGLVFASLALLLLPLGRRVWKHEWYPARSRSR